MDLKGFRKKLMTAVQEKLPDVVLYEQDARKNNGVVFCAITVQEKGCNIGPCIFIEGFYDEYQSGKKSMESIAEEFVRLYWKKRGNENFDVSQFMDYAKARPRIRGRLVNTEKNKEMLGNMLHRDFLDLSLIYCVDFESGDGSGKASIQIHESQMERWEVTEEDLYEQFHENIEREDNSEIVSLMDILSESGIPFVNGQEGATDEPDMVPMYVLTNQQKLDGAVEILNKKAMKKAAAMLGDDFYILPSSVHETILIPVRGNEDCAGELAAMVNEINGTQLAEIEILSGHVYRYCRKRGQIEIAA
ncbi:DUF5688 family protein [Lachnospiraceae bacterium 45-W7]